MKSVARLGFCCVLLLACSKPKVCRNKAGDSLPAFPGAKGFGGLATGGRGGKVIKVTTLNPYGPGSLQEALDVNEPRIIVFDVSGVIRGDIEVSWGNVTIAGQTAPGAGITIAGRFYGIYDYEVDNIIVRHLRIRPKYRGDVEGEQFDAMQFSRNSTMIFDHMSVAFGVDETVDLYEAKNVTFQWSTIESSATSGHPEGEHNFALINGPEGGGITVDHNLFVHHKNRAPALATGPAEVRNNVMYNVRHGFIHQNEARGQFNVVGNYFRRGPSDRMFPVYFDDENDYGDSSLAYFLGGNVVDDPKGPCNGDSRNLYDDCDTDRTAPLDKRRNREFSFQGTCYQGAPSESARGAYKSVLSGAGAWPRDVVTGEVIEDVKKRKGAWGARYPADLMRGLTATRPPVDSDGDGMPDNWERLNDLEVNAKDSKTVMSSGYTAIEEYINERADAISAR